MGTLLPLQFGRSFSGILRSWQDRRVRDEDVARFHILPAQLTQCSDFLTAQGMDVIDAALGAADV